MQIVRLEAENIKRLRAVEIEPSGAVVVIEGKNAAGKSSVLDSIMYAMAGGRKIPAEALRKGERKGKIVLDLGEFVVTRSFTKTGSTLKVENAKGAELQSPQAILDALVGQLSFDPLEFSRLDKQSRLSAVLKVVGLDFSELEAERKALYDERTLTKREAKTLEGQLDGLRRHPGVDGALVITNVLDEIREAEEHNGRIRARSDKLASDWAGLEQLGRSVQAATAEIERLTKERDAMQAREQEVRNRLSAERIEVAALIAKDTTALRAKLAGVEEHNRKAAENQKYYEVQAAAVAKEELADTLTRKIEGLDAKKEKAMAAAKFPLPGLGFDERGVTYNGVVFEECSAAEKIRVSTAMGLALNPKLRVVLIRDGSLLDADGLAAVGAMAKDADAQVWIERVGEGSRGAVLIEDGMVATANAAAAD